MDLYARVNILGGHAVRLPKGDVEEAITLDASPLARAMGWIEKGADRLHIVDLDAAAYSDDKNRPLVDELIAAVDVQVQVAGGVRTEAEAVRLIDAGAWRVVMGTAALVDQNLTWDLCRMNPGRIAISLDALPDGELVIRGWKENSGRYLEEALIEMSSAGAVSFLVSEARRDVLDGAPNLDILTQALEAIDEPVIAAGGVRSLEELELLTKLEASGKRLGGVVVGREVTEGRFTMDQAAELLAKS